MDRGRGRARGPGFWRGRNSWRRPRGRGGTPITPVRPVAPGTRRPPSPPRPLQEQVPCGPYSGWQLYHLDEGYKDSSPTVLKVRAAERHYTTNSQFYPTEDIGEKRSFTLDIRILQKDAAFDSAWPEFRGDLVDRPVHTLACLGLAMHQMVALAMRREMAQELESAGELAPAPVQLPLVHARVTHLEPLLQLKNMKASWYGRLVSVRGTVIRAGGARLQCPWLAFECGVCGAVQCMRQPEGVMATPTACATPRCRGRAFVPLPQSPLTLTVNWQAVRLQEAQSDEQREGGRVPRTLEVELTDDLLDSCMPGDVVTVTGIVQVRNTEDAAKRKAPSLFSMYLSAVSVVNEKGTAPGAVEFKTRDYYAIKEIHGERALFRLLVNSLCPLIFGHEPVKAGLLLALIGGSQREADQRSDTHVLVLGDPGMGKSQMLQACARVAPRGVFVCGNTSSAAGLTVTLTRERGGNFSLEAGALVLADQGVCCVDEFDKMSAQHGALLEAMEQQSVSVAKAGLLCRLPARAAVLAAANPVGGHFDRSRTLGENLRMPAALISRFDLVFVLTDKPDQERDALLSDHVMALHTAGRSAPSPALSVSGSRSGGRGDGGRGGGDARRPHESLAEWLRPQPGQPIDPLPPPLLRTYIAYARRFVQPRITSAAAAALKEFYLELRKRRELPASTRQLRALIRLTEARARLELREEATDADAADVIELVRLSLEDAGISGGGLNLDFSQTQRSSTGRSTTKKFLEVIRRRAAALRRLVFPVSELREMAQSAGVDLVGFCTLLDSLNQQGLLLKKGPQLYQLLEPE